MAGVYALERQTPGFNFENCKRNVRLVDMGFKPPVAQKTGTTIVGIVYKDGVILGADTRATEDTLIADKESLKIHYMARNIYCCGAGTAADTSQTTKIIASQLELHYLMTGRTVPVCTANRLLKQLLFRYQGYIGAALILGGVDNDGPHLYNIHPAGASAKLPFTTMGSGSLAAMAVLESGWRPDLTEEEGIPLVQNAVRAGIFNDLGSGNNLDLCIIRHGSVELHHPYEVANKKGEKQGNYRFQRGTSAILARRVIPVVIESQEIKKIDEEMDTSG